MQLKMDVSIGKKKKKTDEESSMFKDTQSEQAVI